MKIRSWPNWVQISNQSHLLCCIHPAFLSAVFGEPKILQSSLSTTKTIPASNCKAVVEGQKMDSNRDPDKRKKTVTVTTSECLLLPLSLLHLKAIQRQSNPEK